MQTLIIKWIEGVIPPAVFLLTLWLLLEPKFPRRTALWMSGGFWALELAAQGAIYAFSGSLELVFTLLPLTLYLPTIVGAHLISSRRFLPTAVGWLLALLCQYLLLAAKKILVLLTTPPEAPLGERALCAILMLAAVGVLAIVKRWIREPFRASAPELEERWSPLLILPVTLLVLHSYFLSNTSSVAELVLLLLTALSAFWAMVRLMTASAAERQAKESRLQMEALRRDYALLQKKLELGRSYRHDWRHHMLALSALLQEGKADAALDYVTQWQGQLAQVEDRSWCKNAAVNAVLSAYVAQAEAAGCAVEAEVSLPGELPMEELDLCVALANALENAIHACQAQGEGLPRRIQLALALTDRRLALHVENSCAQAVELDADGLPTGARREGHGQGLRSILAVAEKYHGLAKCDWADGVFSLRLVLLDATPEPRPIRRAPAVCAGIFLTVFLLNCAPALAQALEAIPLLGSVVRVVDMRSYSWFWGGTGFSLQAPVLDGDGPAVDAVEAKQEEFLSRMKDAFAYQVARKYQGYVAQDVSYEVVRDDEALFILRLSATINQGGSVDYHHHIVLDKRTGQVLTLADLFDPEVNFVFPISREIKAQMAEQMKTEGASYFLPGGVWPEEECFQSIDPEGQDFYISEAGQLVIAFGEYQVAPGSMGAPEFTIPTDLLDGLLAQPSLLK